MTQWARLGGESMGTTWSAQFRADSRTDLHALHSRIEHRLARIISQMSTWEPGSEISGFNRSAQGDVTRISDDFYQVLRTALNIARASDGALDPTVGELVSLWGYGAHACAQVPTPAQVELALSRCGWTRLQLDGTQQSITQPGGMQLDLSAIAKGYAADAIAQTLAMNLDRLDALIEVGGELVAVGNSNRGAGWNVLLESDPDAAGAMPQVRVVTLRDAAIATSGDQHTARWVDGQLLSHTLDPRLGCPISSSIAAVSVVAISAMLADGWATALSVLGGEQGPRVAEQLGLAARFVLRQGNDFHEVMTDPMRDLLVS